MLKRKKTTNEIYIPESLQGLLVGIDTVKLDPKNPRKNDKAAKRLAELIRLNGWRKPIVVDEETRIVVAGNTSYKAAKLLGMTEIPASIQRFSSEEAAIAYNISDNKASEFSDWDDEVLVELMKAEKLPVREALGFTEKEFNGLILSEKMPEDLPTVEIKGDTEDLGDFLILRFNSSSQLDKAKSALSLGKNERAIGFEDLMNRIGDAWEDLEDCL